jgi:DNA-binding transcriptional MerR regulator
MMSVKEICRVTGVTRKTLFYYDRIGLLEPSRRSGKQNFKEYDEQAVNRLLEIRLYREMGLSMNIGVGTPSIAIAWAVRKRLYPSCV